jgi:hypothetical protein
MSAHQCIATMEVRPIPGFPGYHVSSTGSVFSQWHQGRRGNDEVPGLVLFPMLARVNGHGYYRVYVRQGGARVQLFVHHAVLLAFRGPRPDGHEGRHLDGNKTHNCSVNLEWSTHQINCLDRTVHGTQSHCGRKRKQAGVLTPTKKRVS